MNPEFPTDPRKALEASLTALLLGELPDDQARFLRQAIATDPELAKTFERLKRTTELLEETVASPHKEPKPQPVGPKLCEQRREALLQRFKTVSPPQFEQPVRPRASWLVPAAAAVVLLMAVAGALLPAFSKAKNRSQAQHTFMKSDDLKSLQRPGAASELAAVRSSREQLGEALRRSGDNGRPVQTEEFNFFKQAPAQMTASANSPVLPSAPEQTRIVLPIDNKSDSLTLGASVESEANPAWSISAGDHSLLEGNSRNADSTFSTLAAITGSAGGGGIGGGAMSQEGLGKRVDSDSLAPRNAKKAEIANASGVVLPSVQAEADKEEKAETAQKIALTELAQSVEKPVNEISIGGIASVDGKGDDLKRKTEDRSKGLESANRVESELDRADVSTRKAATPPPVPSPEILTRENAFSTFSLNVSDVSFKLAVASLERGVLPGPADIRSEEFINAFDYRDPEPPAGVPVAFAWERARYPFAQNRDVLRFSIKTAAAGRPAGQPLNLVLLLDNSGSMERADRVRIIHEALRVLATQLQPQDTLSVVTFARTARLWVDGVPGNQAGQVADELSKLTPQGGTNLEEAMNLAYQTALRHYATNGINHVVLLTDGAANLGDTNPEVLKNKVEANRKQGIALDCFGIGWEGYNDDLLEVLTRNGDGRYGFLNTPEEAATEFAAHLAGALHVAASDVKVQVEFNPNRVTSHRQIGYARHQLTKEQFRDNTVDAAEIGAAESGNALYVIEANPQGDGPLAVVRVRYKLPGTAEYREHEWTVPFTGTAASLDQSSPAMRLATTAAAFSEWLASSPYAAEVTSDRLLGYLSGVPGVYGADPRPQKLEWMIRQVKALTGGK